MQFNRKSTRSYGEVMKTHIQTGPSANAPLAPTEPGTSEIRRRSPKRFGCSRRVLSRIPAVQFARELICACCCVCELAFDRGAHKTRQFATLDTNADELHHERQGTPITSTQWKAHIEQNTPRFTEQRTALAVAQEPSQTSLDRCESSKTLERHSRPIGCGKSFGQPQENYSTRTLAHCHCASSHATDVAAQN